MQNPEISKAVADFLEKQLNNFKNSENFDFESFREKVQQFIEESGTTMVILCELPNGGIIQFTNRGMPISRALGLGSYFFMDHIAGLTAHRSTEAIRFQDQFNAFVKKAKHSDDHS